LEGKLPSNHLAEYDIYDEKNDGKLVGSVVIRKSWDGDTYVDVYNGDRTDKYAHDHTWSSVKDTDKEMGYHGFRESKSSKR